MPTREWRKSFDTASPLSTRSALSLADQVYSLTSDDRSDTLVTCYVCLHWSLAIDTVNIGMTDDT